MVEKGGRNERRRKTRCRMIRLCRANNRRQKMRVTPGAAMVIERNLITGNALAQNANAIVESEQKSDRSGIFARCRPVSRPDETSAIIAVSSIGFTQYPPNRALTGHLNRSAYCARRLRVGEMTPF
jgi:hypothetical protein